MRSIKKPYIGQYVMLHSWKDRDFNDPWFIGFLSKMTIIMTEKGTEYRYEADGCNRAFKYCSSISRKEANEWLSRKD